MSARRTKRAVAKLAVGTAIGMALVTLSACAHRDLTAPCSRDSSLWNLGVAYAATGDCGPLHPVNR